MGLEEEGERGLRGARWERGDGVWGEGRWCLGQRGQETQGRRDGWKRG